jgi:hypothetical protein
MAWATQGQSEKLRLGKVINNTVGFIGRNLILLLVVATLFFVLPLMLVNLWTVWYWPRLAFLGNVYGNGSSAVAANVGSALASGLLAAAPNFLGHAVLSRATVDDINGNRPSIGGCIQTALRHFLPIVGIGLVVYLVFFVARFAIFAAGLFIPYGGTVAFAILIVPCVMWGLGIAVAVPVAAKEGLGIDASMSRSRALTRGYRWPIFGLCSIALGLWFVTRVALALAFVLTPAMLTSVSALLVGTIPSALFSAIIWTVTSVAATAIYIELRRIKEDTGVDELAEIFS